MPFLKILFGGIHLEIGRVMTLKKRDQLKDLQWRIQIMIGLLVDGFREECLSMGICGERFGMMHLLCQLPSRSHSLIQIEKVKRLVSLEKFVFCLLSSL